MGLIDRERVKNRDKWVKIEDYDRGDWIEDWDRETENRGARGKLPVVRARGRKRRIIQILLVNHYSIDFLSYWEYIDRSRNPTLI